MFYPVVLAVIKKDDTYLLTKRSQIDAEDDASFKGKWEIPGGGLEFGESVEDCLHREVMEELGIEVDIQTILPSVYHRVKKKNHWHGVFLCYLCTMVDEGDPIVLNEESSDYRWMSLSEVEKIKTLPHVKELLQEADSIFLM